MGSRPSRPKEPDLPPPPHVDTFPYVKGYIYTPEGADIIDQNLENWVRICLYNQFDRNYHKLQNGILSQDEQFRLLYIKSDFGPYNNNWTNEQKNLIYGIQLQNYCIVDINMYNNLLNNIWKATVINNPFTLYLTFIIQYTSFIDNKEESYLFDRLISITSMRDEQWSYDNIHKQNYYVLNQTIAPKLVYKIESNSNLNIINGNQYYILNNDCYEYLELILQCAVQKGMPMENIPKDSNFNFDINPPEAYDDNDSELLKKMGIAFEVIKWLSVAVEIAFGIAAFFTFGIAEIIKQLIALTNEIIRLTGAYDDLLQVIENATPDIFNLIDYNDDELEQLDEVQPIKQLEEELNQNPSILAADVDYNYDDLSLDQLAALSILTNEAMDETNRIDTHMTNFMTDYDAQQESMEERELENSIKDILKHPAFIGIITGMTAMVVFAGPRCLKLLKNAAKRIFGKAKEWVKKIRNKIRNKVKSKAVKIKSTKAKLKSRKQKIDSVLKKKVGKEKDKLDAIIKKWKEILKKEVKEHMKEYRNKFIEDIVESLKKFKIKEVELPSTAKTVTAISIVTLLVGGGIDFFKNVFDQLIKLLPELKDLIEVAFKLMSYGVDTFFIMSFIGPAVAILYMTIALIHKLEYRTI